MKTFRTNKRADRENEERLYYSKTSGGAAGIYGDVCVYARVTFVLISSTKLLARSLRNTLLRVLIATAVTVDISQTGPLFNKDRIYLPNTRRSCSLVVRLNTNISWDILKRRAAAGIKLLDGRRRLIIAPVLGVAVVDRPRTISIVEKLPYRHWITSPCTDRAINGNRPSETNMTSLSARKKSIYTVNNFRGLQFYSPTVTKRVPNHDVSER